MVRSVKPYIALAFVYSALAGCSMFQREERPAWRNHAEEVCLAEKQVHVSSYVQPAAPIDGPGICGMEHPFKTTALADGTVKLDSRATLACPMLPMLDRWVLEIVQPFAQARFAQPVVEIKTMGSYGCRTIDHIRGASLSEHSFGNAIDVAGFVLADGREINVQRGWKGSDDQQRAFLREVQAGACTYFTTVLAPGADAFHYNHIHVDLARHAMLRDGTMHRVCKPLPQAVDTPNPNFNAAPPDQNAEGEDIGAQGAVSLAPLAVAAPPVSYAPRPIFKAPPKSSAFAPPGAIGQTSLTPQYLPQTAPQEDIDVSQFDLPAKR